MVEAALYEMSFPKKKTHCSKNFPTGDMQRILKKA